MREQETEAKRATEQQLNRVVKDCERQRVRSEALEQALEQARKTQREQEEQALAQSSQLVQLRKEMKHLNLAVQVAEQQAADSKTEMMRAQVMCVGLRISVLILAWDV